MRVLQLTTDLRFAGAERVIVNLARGLRRRGVECAVAGLFAGGEPVGGLRRRLGSEGVEVYATGLEGPMRLWRLAHLRRFALDWRSDLLHCHMWHGNAAGALLRLTGLGVPFVRTHHTVDRRDPPLRRAFDRFTMPLAACEVHVSRAVARHRRWLFGNPPRSQVIHNGLELAPLLQVSPSVGHVIGAVGRLVHAKGHDVLLRAFARLLRDGVPARLRIAGEGPQRSALGELATRLGVEREVEFVGFVDNVAAFLSGTSVFVMPSRWEGFGLALVEALAAGLPCVASRVDSLPEVGGRFVRWVPPGDVEALRRAMCAALAAERAADAVARQRAWVTRFSAERMTERYLALYNELSA